MMPILPPGSPSRQSQRRSRDHDPIVIGVVNNMPDAALRTTERQFRELLFAASHNAEICLRFFSLPELPRSDAARAHVRQHYEDIRDLWTSRLDGLIVTGTEPRAPALADEPYWPTLTKLIDWAEDHTISTAWSCLAAHAAVLHIDGIGRYALPQKLSGVFECRKATEHTLVVGAPPKWFVPHSRHNDLPQEALITCGYHILSRLPDVGVDMFAKRRKSLFFFVQGHPEYDPAALLREYRRDVERFLAGERDGYPEMPRGYFSEETAAHFIAFRQEALRRQGIDLASRIPAAVFEAKLAHAWRELAVCIYANWMSYLAEQKGQSFSPTRSHATPTEQFEQNVTV